MTQPELEKQQTQLQDQARQIIAELDLVKSLDQIGPTAIVGSLALGLMVWPDIDIETHVVEYQVEDLLRIAKYLLEQPNTIDVTLRDYRLDLNPNKPKGLYLGVKYQFESVRWKIDIWLIKPEHKQELDITSQMSSLNKSQYAAILTIKNSVWDHPEYRKQFTSVDIYSAVLQQNARTLDDFKRYLAKTGRHIQW